MDQIRIGQHLKTLRREKGLTQEQLGECLGVSSRSVSRWENGVNLPDFDLMIELGKLYGVSMDELLKGESNTVSEETEQALYLAAEYTGGQRERLLRRLHVCAWVGVAAWIVFLALTAAGLADAGWTEKLVSAAAGLAFGMALVTLLYTGTQMEKLRAFKLRLLKRDKGDKA